MIHTKVLMIVTFFRQRFDNKSVIDYVTSLYNSISHMLVQQWVQLRD